MRHYGLCLVFRFCEAPRAEEERHGSRATPHVGTILSNGIDASLAYRFMHEDHTATVKTVGTPGNRPAMISIRSAGHHHRSCRVAVLAAG